MCRGCDWWLHHSTGNTATAAHAVWGTNSPPRRRSNIVWTISGGRRCGRTLHDAVPAMCRPQSGFNSTRACARGGVYAGSCALVSHSQREARGGVYVLAISACWRKPLGGVTQGRANTTAASAVSSRKVKGFPQIERNHRIGVVEIADGGIQCGGRSRHQRVVIKRRVHIKDDS